MKLIIQIPCFNEEDTLPATLRDLPRHIEGVDSIEIQIIDDGSTDRTVEVARELGVHHIISFRQNRGLAAAFKAGMDSALERGADILVNTDADNQYRGSDIAKIVRPIIEHRADIVIGCRPIMDHPEFSFPKKILQRFGSWVLRNVSRTSVRDAASGFRAYSLNGMLRLNIYSKFSYCMETLIQAGRLNMKIESVDIRVNPKTRESRLFTSIKSYILKSGRTIVDMYLLYRARFVFVTVSLLFFSAAATLAARYLILIYFFGADRTQFWPSIILSGVLVVMSLQTLMTGILASLVAANRHLSEEVIYRLKKTELEQLRRQQSLLQMSQSTHNAGESILPTDPSARMPHSALL